MGAAARHRRKFLSIHKLCAFCGGKAPATTIEHCPPRSMFQFRYWPEGFEFPSCESCNGDTSDHDLLIAMLARMDPFEDKGDRDGKYDGLMRKVNQQFPGLFNKMIPSASEARRRNREFGLQPAPGQTHQQVSPVSVPDEIHQAVCVLARKLAKGIYYRESGIPFPDNGCLMLNWFTNAELFRTDKDSVFSHFKELAGIVPQLRRSGKYLNDQFEYKLSASAEKDILVLQAVFGKAFGLVVLGSSLPGKLENIIINLREKNQSDGPFVVLQSPSLA